MMMKDWFRNLAPREQLLIGIAAALAAITLVVTFGVRPVISNSVQGQERVSDKRELLREIEQVAERIGPQTGARQVVPDSGSQSLVVIVDSTTRSNGLAQYLKRNQPDGSDSIRLRFEGAPFDTVIAWLGIMQDQYGLFAMAANFDGSGAPGRINCNLTLSRDGR